VNQNRESFGTIYAHKKAVFDYSLPRGGSKKPNLYKCTAISSTGTIISLINKEKGYLLPT